jgi:hypothetical protein
MYVMKKTIKVLVTGALAIFFSSSVNAQQIPTIKDVQTPYVEPLKLDGPRIGVSFADGYNLNALREFLGDSTFNPQPYMTLFGWQFEWQYFQTADGGAGLIEFIPMIAGLDQGLLLPAANIMVGYRNRRGLEFGFGPQLNLAGSGVVAALGYNFSNGHVNFPVNLAFVKGKDTFRIGLTFGFNKRTRA